MFDLFLPRELVQNMEQNVVLKKQVSDWTTQNQKQTCHSFIVIVYMVVNVVFYLYFLEIVISSMCF